MVKQIRRIVRPMIVLLMLVGLLGVVPPGQAQSTRRPDLIKRVEPAEKTKKPRKSTRGGVIKPVTIKNNQGTRLLTEDPPEGDPFKVVEEGDSTEGFGEKAKAPQNKEWEKDESIAVHKVQTRRKAKIILGDSKTPTYKQYIEEPKEEDEDSDSDEGEQAEDPDGE